MGGEGACGGRITGLSWGGGEVPSARDRQAATGDPYLIMFHGEGREGISMLLASIRARTRKRRVHVPLTSALPLRLTLSIHPRALSPSFTLFVLLVVTNSSAAFKASLSPLIFHFLSINDIINSDRIFISRLKGFQGELVIDKFLNYILVIQKLIEQA